MTVPISDTEERDRDAVLRRVGLGLFTVGLCSLITAVLWKPGEHAPVQHVFRELFIQVWPFTLTAAASLLLYERMLRQSFVREMERVSGPPIVRTLLPRQVMDTFLAHIYGEQQQNRHVVAGVLGGAGEKPQAADLTISTSTTVEYVLKDKSEVPGEYELTATVSYTSKHPVTDARLALFAVSGPELRDTITLACDLPIFDYWYFPSPRQLRESVSLRPRSISTPVSLCGATRLRRPAVLTETPRVRPGCRSSPPRRRWVPDRPRPPKRRALG